MTDKRKTPDTLLNEQATRERLGGIGHTKFFDLIKSGELRTVTIGRRRFVPSSEVDRFIADRTA